MKKFLSLAALLPGVSMACGDLSAYNVEALAFQQLPTHQAIAETVKGTPFRVVHVGNQPAGLVNAHDVSGKLDEVLASLLDQAGLVYAKNECELTIMPREKRVFSLAAGDMIHVRLGEWLKNHGYALYWDAPKYLASGALSVEGPLDETLNEIVSVMGANGVRLSAEIYENRAVRVMEAK